MAIRSRVSTTIELLIERLARVFGQQRSEVMARQRGYADGASLLRRTVDLSSLRLVGQAEEPGGSSSAELGYALDFASLM